MTNKEILHNVVLKAEENGYKFSENNKPFYPIINSDFEYPYVYYTEDFTGAWSLHINEIIFDHDFAKALWGEQKHNFIEQKSEVELCDKCPAYLIPHEGGTDVNYCWQYNLQQMILEKEPLKYLEKFLGE